MEILNEFFEQLADGFEGYGRTIFHWLSLSCLGVFGIVFYRKRLPAKIRAHIKLLCFLLCIILLPVCWLGWPPPAAPVPSLSLDVGPSIDLKKPFVTTLTICNTGTVAVSNVWAMAYWSPTPSGPKDLQFVYETNRTGELDPSMKHVLNFDELGSSNDTVSFGDPTYVNVELRFSATFPTHENSHIYRFYVLPSPSYGYVWTPAEDGKPVDAMTSRIQENAQIIAEIPIMQIGMMDVSEDTNFDVTHPLALHFGWKNFGGAPATNVRFEWYALAAIGSAGYTWHNRWGDEVLKDVVEPGTGRSIFVRYGGPGNISSHLYKGIMDGTISLIALVSFKDKEDHDYQQEVKITRNENSFETEYIRYAGYYAEVVRKRP